MLSLAHCCLLFTTAHLFCATRSRDLSILPRRLLSAVSPLLFRGLWSCLPTPPTTDHRSDVEEACGAKKASCEYRMTNSRIMAIINFKLLIDVVQFSSEEELFIFIGSYQLSFESLMEVNNLFQLLNRQYNPNRYSILYFCNSKHES